MIKNKAFLIFVAALFLNLSLNNVSQAAENKGSQNWYPDYAYEFVGKDKFEGFNRKIFIFNLKANKYIIRPINTVWASVMPQYGMDRVSSFYTNLKYPVRLAGCLLQKDFKSSKTETVRFLTNTTLGFAGLYDVAKSKFKIEPHQEDIEQVLAYHNIKKGPYLVLPIVAQGNIRDIVGQALDLPLNPTSYIVGPIALASTGVSYVNSTTSMQPIFKMADGYADPYEVSKQLYGIERYIKNMNLDRKEVFAEKTASENVVKISNVSAKAAQKPSLKADIELSNYNPQGSEIDSLRTILFDSQKMNNSVWSEMSVWNKDFAKKLKISSVSVDSARPGYKYRYRLQKNKTAPLAILYPSIGEGIMSNQSTVFAKMLYDEGYSVVIQGSPFQWEFVKSMPEAYGPGLPPQDAKYLRLVTSKIVTDLQNKKGRKFDNKILVGTSFGGLTTLFVAAQEESENTLGISNYIVINPPIEIFYELKQLDKYCQNWQNNPSDIKMRAAITAKKVVDVAQTDYKKNPKETPVSLPFTDDEAKLAISYAMKLKLANLVFTIDENSRAKINDSYEAINNMSFSDYAQKYLQAPMSAQGKSFDQLKNDSSLYSIAGFLQKNNKYKIYQSLDDCYVNQEQLIWLKKQSGDKAVLFSNGSHLGFLYRNEFLDEFKKDIKLQSVSHKQKL
jgi:phospholipid-binding lipoprotein MlaA